MTDSEERKVIRKIRDFVKHGNVFSAHNDEFIRDNELIIAYETGKYISLEKVLRFINAITPKDWLKDEQL